MGEQRRRDSRIAYVTSTTRQGSRTRRIRMDIAEKSICELRLNLDNLSGNKAVRLPVAGVCCFGIWCLDETEDFPTILVNPIFQVVNAVLLLRFEIGHMGLCDVFRCNVS